MIEIFSQIDTVYLDVCRNLLHAPKVGNTREINNVKIMIDDVENANTIVSVRDISATYLFAELLWYFEGRNDTKFIGQFASMWNDISDDGKTANSAYGYIIKSKYYFDQAEKVIELLRKDPRSRRAKINLNTPNKGVIETKDEPCTMSLHYLIRDGKLHATAVMRSNDIWFGFPYDVAFFTELQRYIAKELGIPCGSYTHFVVSMHLYDRDYGKVKEIVENPTSIPIVFDREKFHKDRRFISELLNIAMRHDIDCKELLMNLLHDHDIYTENTCESCFGAANNDCKRCPHS